MQNEKEYNPFTINIRLRTLKTYLKWLYGEKYISVDLNLKIKKVLDAMTEGMLKMMGVFSEMERNMISERVKSGMRNAKAKGKVVGRPTTSIDDVPVKVVKAITC